LCHWSPRRAWSSRRIESRLRARAESSSAEYFRRRSYFFSAMLLCRTPVLLIPNWAVRRFREAGLIRCQKPPMMARSMRICWPMELGVSGAKSTSSALQAVRRLVGKAPRMNTKKKLPTESLGSISKLSSFCLMWLSQRL
jgi:hypothetical protein